jgi:hypothetical protein
MINQKIDGIEIAIANLITGSFIHSTLMPKSEFSSRYKSIPYSSKQGCFNLDKKSIIFFPNDEKNFVVIEVSRKNIPLVTGEKELLKIIPGITQHFAQPLKSEFAQLVLRLTLRVSIEDLIVARYIRKENDSKFWTPALILLILKDLTFKRYEGDKCTSGFIFCREASYFSEIYDKNIYLFEPFEKAIELDNSFFNSIASYRYVDGKNCYYLIDNWRRIYGIIRIKTPSKFSLIERTNNIQFNSFLETKTYGKKWVAYVGNNDSLIVVNTPTTYFKWTQNHWKFRDINIIETLLKEHIDNSNFLDDIIKIVITLSELRKGSVILIKRDMQKEIPVIGKIDNARVGELVRTSFTRKHLKNLIDQNNAIGILSSDGLTTFSADGNLISCGDIIDIQGAVGNINQGGGRTKAAIASSYYGISIKVSEDGPISIFKDGEMIVEI